MKYIKKFKINEGVRVEKPIYGIDDIVTSKRSVPRRKITNIGYEDSWNRRNIVYEYVDEDINDQQARIINDMEKTQANDDAFSLFKHLANRDKKIGWSSFPRTITQTALLRWRDK